MITIRDVAWIAGFLEGEGSFVSKYSGTKKMPYPNSEVTAIQKQKEPLERLQTLVGGNLYLVKNKYWRWSTCGARARGIALTVFSLMSPRRKEQIKNMLQKDTSLSPSKLREIRGKGFREMHTKKMLQKITEA